MPRNTGVAASIIGRMQLTLLNWLLALLPVLVILVLMLVFNWGGSRAGAASWFIAILIANQVFAADARLIAYSQAKAIILSLNVLYVIWMALLLYHIADEAGAVKMIGESLPRLTSDRTMQALLLGWVFISFLQGLGGLGVPVAVTAPLLVGLGFSPVQSVIIASLGHAWAVNFGSMATAFLTLLAVTNLPAELLAPPAAVLLGSAAVICGVVVAYLAGGWKGLWRNLPATVLLGSVMGGVQYLLVVQGVWTLGTTGAAMAGLLVGIGWAHIQRARSPQPAPPPATKAIANLPADGQRRSLPLSFSAYAVLVVLAFALNLIHPIKTVLDRVQLRLTFPELQTGMGYVNSAESSRQISVFGHPGAILLYASLIAFAVYSLAGYYRPGAAKRILERVGRGAVTSSLGVVAMVGMAVVMSQSGMTSLVAEGVSRSFGERMFPLVSPFIGVLGAFITGSNSNSNVLFAVLQMRTAELLGLSVPLILAAQTAGGSLGSIIAPAKVIVGCSTVGLEGKEDQVIGKLLIYGMIPVVFVAIMMLFLRGT